MLPKAADTRPWAEPRYVVAQPLGWERLKLAEYLILLGAINDRLPQHTPGGKIAGVGWHAGCLIA